MTARLQRDNSVTQDVQRMMQSWTTKCAVNKMFIFETACKSGAQKVSVELLG